MRKAALYSVVVPGLLAAAMLGQNIRRPIGATTTSAHELGEEIHQPPGWVPFEADIELTNPGRQTVIGKFYRASDGSARRETWDPDTPGRRVISIKNFTEHTRYLKSQDGQESYGWKRFPLGEAQIPLRYRVNQYTVPHSEQIEGFSIYRQTGVRGDVRLLAPDLNFFPLLSQIIKTGRREAYKNIRRTEPPADLFAPLSGEKVEVLEAKDDPLNPYALPRPKP